MSSELTEEEKEKRKDVLPPFTPTKKKWKRNKKGKWRKK